MEKRDKALVDVLQRIADEMTHQDEMLEKLIAGQGDFTKLIEQTGLHLRGTQADAERSYDNLHNAISHYRSDMLSLVNEQDHINRNIEELLKIIKTTILTTDVTNQNLEQLNERVSRFEKTSAAHYESMAKQPDILRSSLADMSRDVLAMYTKTEKHLSELSKETTKQFDGFQHETLCRLLLLDSIVSSLETLLLRTEPPEKKPGRVARIFNTVHLFFDRIFSRKNEK